MRLRVGLLGGGSWGTTVASVVSRNAPITLWARDAATVDGINRLHENHKYLPGIKLPPALRATADMAEAVAGADVLVVGVPSHSFRAVLEEAKRHLRPWVPVISLTKGLELDTEKRMTELIEDILPGHPVGVLTGPNLAREIMGGQAAASVLSMEDEIVVRALQPLFHSGLFRVYTNTDLLGCELGGVLKNIVAIAVGMGDGLGAGDNTRAALMTRGLAEITRLGVAMGGRAETFAGLAGMGDLIATCTSALSRNRHVGVELGRGRAIDDIVADMHMVAEGVKSAPTVIALARHHGIDMPIARDVFDATQGRRSAQEIFRGLLRSSVGDEAHPG
ncbi:NAD(P)H-dependent glycerol-3-phosphate dehydrogenase [Sphingopyxis panaciterrulae]|uniref:Glycerol-3-phosphate dehydrogenase [NAD(P)+] n=1 Tax=Sphingopyxis panaciterrulae TaxID=462372 RepID=A0A7W9B9E7_9SPHN|nr:NAD(P)H-dependent glycerol-3-phosphate dehydrogenase [Sphingopyxis panaciterrulae]MBB5708683.1 glycerol-3-phosphate dehydrogenase (NAD(P)+) [Sphingopyxis panaciterrulae]